MQANGERRPDEWLARVGKAGGVDPGGGGRSPAPRQKVPRLHTRAHSQLSGRSGRRTGRAASGSPCLQLLRGGFSAEAQLASLSQFRGGDAVSALTLSLPLLRLQVRNLARPCKAATARGPGRRGAGAGTRAGCAASDTSPWRPLPRQRRQPSPRPRTLRTLGVATGVGSCAGTNPCRGVSRVRPTVWTQRSLPSG